jgi:hypothetical protein
MRFLKRTSIEPEVPTDFWTWWDEARGRVEQAITGGGFDKALLAEINRAVATVDPAMAWIVAPGHQAAHALCLSPEGNARLRQVALRWLAMAPPPDATWEYHASKPAATSLATVGIGGVMIDLGEMRTITSWDETRRRLDVRLWHPAFPTARPDVTLQATFIFLDSLLGEDEVERWIGAIDLLEAPTGGRTPAELKAEVERHRDDPADGETWVLGERTRSDGAFEILLVDAGIKRIDHPFADHHVTISVILGTDRLPNDAEATVLNAEEDDLLQRIDGAATFVGRTTTAGVRTMHFVAEEPDRMRPAIDAWAAAIPDALLAGMPRRRIKVSFERDMDWAFQKGFGVG